MRRTHKIKEPKIIRRGRGESDSSYTERTKKRERDLEHYETYSPLEFLSSASLKRICQRRGWIASGSREELVKRIQQAEKGEIEPDSSNKQVFAVGTQVAPMEMKMVTIYFVAGTNASVEHIPKPIWNYILPFLDGDDVLSMRSTCKYFYVICTPFLGRDMKMWSLYSDAKKDHHLYDKLRRIGHTNDLLENIKVGIKKHGSTQGIAKKIESLHKNSVVMKQRRRELKEIRETRLKEINDAFECIGVHKYANHHQLKYKTDENAGIVFDFIHRILHKGYCSEVYLRDYVNNKRGDYAKTTSRILSHFHEDQIMAFAKAFSSYNSKVNEKTRGWDWNDPRRESVWSQQSHARKHLEFLFEQFKKNGQLPNFEIELNQFLKF